MIPETTCLNMGRLRPDPQWRIEATAHRNHELIVVLHGRMQVTATDETVCAGSGDVMLYPAGLAHAEEADPADPPETLFFSFVAPRLHGRRIRRVHDHDGRMRQIARWMHADQSARDASARGEAVSEARSPFRARLPRGTVRRPRRSAARTRDTKGEDR